MLEGKETNLCKTSQVQSNRRQVGAPSETFGGCGARWVAEDQTQEGCTFGIRHRLDLGGSQLTPTHVISLSAQQVGNRRETLWDD